VKLTYSPTIGRFGCRNCGKDASEHGVKTGFLRRDEWGCRPENVEAHDPIAQENQRAERIWDNLMELARPIGLDFEVAALKDACQKPDALSPQRHLYGRTREGKLSFRDFIFLTDLLNGGFPRNISSKDGA
jgi:hypothetical protein